MAGVGLLALRCSKDDGPSQPAGTPGVDQPAKKPNGARRTIAEENQLPGDSGWRIDRPALIGEIAGYCGQVSVQPGETLDVHVSTMTAGAKYEADVYRMGWYGGAGGRVVRSIKNIDGENQGRWDPLRGVQECRTCKVDPETLLIECGWKRSLQIKTADDWVSGYYLVRLHELNSDTAAYAIFIVRDDKSETPMIVQASTNTWQAYNVWGDASTYGSFGADRRYIEKTRRAYRVSYDRPYDPNLNGNLNGQMQMGAGEFFRWEYNFVRWAESQGYEISYTTNVDVHRRPETLLRHRMFVSLGHDEYWTKQQRDAVEAARDAGVNLAFFSGNEVYWQSRLEESSSGDERRVLTCYKDASLDPEARKNPAEATVLFTDAPVSRPQSMLSGLAYGSNTIPDYIAWTPVNTDTWIFDGTGIVAEEAFPGIVGYEYDHMAPADKRPEGLTVVARSAVNGFLGQDTSASTIYTAASGATVFAAGTIGWSWGLDDFGHENYGAFANPKLRKLTANIIERLTLPRTVPTPR